MTAETTVRAPCETAPVVKSEDCEKLIVLLKRGTAAVAPIYFNLPVAGGNSKYRERVYCYELYHQLRTLWPPGFPYVLNGELDKAGHAVMQRLGATGIPDFLVHGPGDMSHNLVIIEVKPVDHIVEKNLGTDLEKLAKFTSFGNGEYELGIYLVYGGTEETFNEVRGWARRWVGQEPGRTLDKVRLVWHRESGTPAMEEAW